jgi:hypothetical protein
MVETHSVTRCSECNKRLYGIMSRQMQIIYYEGTENPKVAHSHVDKKGRPVPWTANILQEANPQ